MLFHACPLLHQWSNDHENAFNLFMQYKTRVPVCGAIMLNSTWDKVSSLMLPSGNNLSGFDIVRASEGLEIILRVGFS